MSSLTLHAGIENMLKYYIKEVVAVKGVEDENSEVDPYYK
jgi:Fe-S cluster biogenesis protein NfuA